MMHRYYVGCDVEHVWTEPALSVCPSCIVTSRKYVRLIVLATIICIDLFKIFYKRIPLVIKVNQLVSAVVILS